MSLQCDGTQPALHLLHLYSDRGGRQQAGKREIEIRGVRRWSWDVVHFEERRERKGKRKI